MAEPTRWTSLRRRRAGVRFYTTPLKALSNQKYAELRRHRYGEEHVGLLHRRCHARTRGRRCGRDDHRGAAQHALRRIAPTVLEAAHDVSSSDEVHFIGGPLSADRSGRRSVLSAPRRSASGSLSPRLPRTTPTSSPGGCRTVRGARSQRIIERQRRPIVLRPPLRAVHRRNDDEIDAVPPTCTTTGGRTSEGLAHRPGWRRARRDRRRRTIRPRARGPAAAPPGPTAHRDDRGRFGDRDAARLAIYFIFSRVRLRRRDAPVPRCATVSA